MDHKGTPQQKGNSSTLREKGRPEREKRRNSETHCVTSEEVPAKRGTFGWSIIYDRCASRKCVFKGAITIKY
jgi:hypothetical protein